MFNVSTFKLLNSFSPFEDDFSKNERTTLLRDRFFDRFESIFPSFFFFLRRGIDCVVHYSVVKRGRDDGKWRDRSQGVCAQVFYIVDKSITVYVLTRKPYSDD